MIIVFVAALGVNVIVAHYEGVQRVGLGLASAHTPLDVFPPSATSTPLDVFPREHWDDEVARRTLSTVRAACGPP